MHSVSPGGRALTDNFSFSLDNPAAASLLPTPPSGGSAYTSTLGFNFRVNDNGDLGGFHLTVTQPRNFLFRYHAANATWQQLAPDGLAVDVSPRLSPAYPPNALPSLGGFTDPGVLLSNLVLGGVNRAVKLMPISACVGTCLRVASIQLTGKVVRKSPANNCGQPTCTLITASVRVTNAAGTPQSNVRVGVRLMNSYTLDSAVTGRTNGSGVATLNQLGLVGAGTVSMRVGSLGANGASFDPGNGTLTAKVIPQ